jgi:hypothetical protein
MYGVFYNKESINNPECNYPSFVLLIKNVLKNPLFLRSSWKTYSTYEQIDKRIIPIILKT